MKIIIKLIVLLTIFSLIQSCTPFYKKQYYFAQDKYENGNYEEAIAYCVSSLKNNPDYLDAMDLLEVTYNKVIEEKEKNIKDFKKRKNPFYWDDVYKSYYEIIKINEYLISNNINLREFLLDKINKNDNNAYIGIEEATNQAAEQHYLEGIKLRNFKDVDNQKNAAKHFTLALHYIPDYKDAQKLYNDCKENAIKRIAIIPFEDLTSKGGKYGSVSDVLVDDITSQLFNDKQASEFIELITREQLENVIREQSYTRSELFDQATAVKIGKLLQVHEIIVGKISQIIYTPERTTSRKIIEKANALVGTKIEYDKKGRAYEVPVWGEVVAEVTVFKKTAKAQINGSYKIIDVQTGKIKSTESCSNIEEFDHEWATFRGNQQALGYESQSLCSKTEAYPDEEIMVNKALNKLSLQLFRRISDYTK